MRAPRPPAAPSRRAPHRQPARSRTAPVRDAPVRTVLSALAALAVVVGTAPACAPTTRAPTTRAPTPWSGLGGADTVRVDPLAPGVRHVYLWLREGPWAVHVVEIDERRCRPVVAAVKAGPPLDERAPTSALGDAGLAAVNADFFMTPGGTPVGAHVRAGRTMVGPGSRPVYGLGPDARHWAGVAELAGSAAVPGDTAGISQVNRPVAGGRHHPPRAGLTLFDGWYGPRAPVDSAGPTVRLRRLGPGSPGHPVGARGDGGIAVVTSTHPAGEGPPLDGRHLAFQATGAAARDWLDRRMPGDTVTWWTALVGPVPSGRATAAGGAALGGAALDRSSGAAEAVGGFPLLLADGRGVLAEQEGVIASFGEARHPRTALAWDTAGGRLLWVVVDGRQSPYSAGMTLGELEALLLRLGATDGINLDGGGSTTLVVRGVVANRPSDAAGERSVANALVLEGCRRERLQDPGGGRP